MNDRELLEAAAKAAGLRVNFHPAASYNWNPLTSDADALRLAVQLRLDVDCAGGEVVVAYEQITHAHAAERVGDDPIAATRRAIVRAAAEIGRSKT
jgi:hypothetical protein